MLPTIASPLASAASGAALPLASALAGVVAPPPSAPPRGAEIAAAAVRLADAFLEPARDAGLVPAGRTPASARARTTDAGYAAATTPGSSTGAKKTTATTASSSATKTSGSTAAKTSAATATKAGPLAFLDDKALSVEEKLMRLLSYLSAKWDKDLEKKLKEFQTGQQQGGSTTTAAAPKKKSGGLLGSIGSVVGAATKFFPAVGIAVEALKNPAIRAVVSKIGGPVLAAAATALGYPALAPLLLKYGPAVVDVAAGIAGSVDGGTTGSGGTSASGGTAAASAGSSPSETGMNDREMQLKLMEIQRIRDLQKEMFSMVSQILRSGHETRMNVIQNIR
jgi:hypothetical protein